MRHYNKLQRFLYLLVIVALVLCSWMTMHFTSEAPSGNGSTAFVTRTPLPPSTPTEDSSSKSNIDVPVRLKIPSIKVDAALEQVGLLPDGELGSPKDPANAAWYNQGPRPGAAGNAIIDGHFGYRNRTPAVFDNLHVIQKGDKIYVENATGESIVFIVREVRKYQSDYDTASVFVSHDGKAHLNLITCQGEWSNAQNSFLERFVVFADKFTEDMEQ